MLRRLITSSLDFPFVALLLAVGLVAAGIWAAKTSPWDVFPEFAPPQIVVQTEAPGLSAEEVERLVTVPVESAVNGVSGLAVLRSSSVPGLSVITAVFHEGTPILDARQLVAERLAEARTLLPAGVQAPRMTPLAASTSRLAMVALTSDTVSSMEMRTWADWTLRRRLQGVSGVARVEIFGGEVRQYQVLVRPEQLQAYRVSLDEVTTAARNATAFGGAGFVETINQRLPIRQRTRIESVDDLAAVPVAVRNGVSLQLGRVAEVTLGAADKVGDAVIDGRAGVLLVIHKQPTANMPATDAAVQHALDELQVAVPRGVTLHRSLFRQSTFIERAISNLGQAILIGCVLVGVVLIVFLFQWRTVVISLTAIPLSLLGAVAILRGLGFSLNAMTLGGLAIALGEVVDDAIVDVENVLRRLQENRRSAAPRSAYAVVLDASLEVRSAVVYASFIVMLVFVPVYFLDGLPGAFFRPLGLAYVVAILVSLVVALTVTPAMCLLLLRNVRSGTETDPPFIRWSKRVYGRLLPLALRIPRTMMLGAAALIVAGAALVPFLGGEFLPDFRESNFVVFMAGKPDGSLAESVRIGKHLAERLRAVPGVSSIAQQIGRADLSEDTWGPNISEVWVVLDPAADYDATLAALRKEVEEIPGAQFQVKQFLRERIDEVLTGVTSDIAIRIVGEDLQVLRTLGSDVAKTIAEVRGVEDLRVEQQVDVPQIEVLLRPRDVAGLGFSVGALNQAIQTTMRGTTVGQVYEQEAVFDVVVRAHPDHRRDPTELGRLLVDSPNGDKIPLSAVAQISVEPAPNGINHEAARRRLLVTCNAEGRDVAGVVTEIERRLREKGPKLPSGYHWEIGGEYQARSEAAQRMLWLGLASLIGIFVLLYLDFKTVRLTTLVMLSVPLAAVGGVVAVLATGGDLSLGSLVGFVTLFGVTIRNGILLISHYEHLRNEGSTPDERSLLITGAAERLAPILMTAGTTALGLLPLIVAGKSPGSEIEYPMAIVITGGLISSTLLTLFVLPAVYERFGRTADS